MYICEADTAGDCVDSDESGGGGDDTGDTGDTGDSGDTEDTSGWDRTPCAPAERYGTTFSFNPDLYADWDGTGGTECACSAGIAWDGTPDRLEGDIEGDASGGDSQIPMAASVITPGNHTWGGGTNVSSDGTWWSSTWGWNDTPTEGTWDFRLTAAARAGHVGSCDEYVDVSVKVDAAGRSARPAPARPVSPRGPESDRDCVPGETHTTRFRLAGFPGWTHPLPLAVGGHPRFAGSRVTGVAVVDWNGADRLLWRNDGQERLLSLESPSAALPAGDWWFGTSEWLPDRVADADPWQTPVVDLTHTCPASPASPTVPVATGYGLSLGQLDQAVGVATGALGISGLITAAADPEWPVYAVRVVPDPDPVPGLRTHRLRLELRGTRAGVSLPMLAQGPDLWNVTTDGPNLWVEGTVTRSGSALTLHLDGGTVTTDSGSLALQPADLVLGALGEGQ